MERFDFFRIQDIVSHVREFTSQEWLFYGGLGVGAMSLLFVAVKTVVRRWRGPPATPVASKTLQDIKSVQDAIAVEDIGPSGKQGYLKQPFEAFLVLDVEGTCEEGSSFDYPNEIIEMPVALMEWKSRLSGGKSRELVLKAEFHTFVKPSWKPALSTFCKKLTGITQKEIDAAPDFPEALSSLEQFLTDQGLIDPTTGERKMNFCWCTDGPFDIRDFMVKQAFISQVPLPGWIQGQVLDVRQMVADWCKYGTANQKKVSKISIVRSIHVILIQISIAC
ncbi:hypothetical protein V5O48_004735 [Marasmius crinis-equi]|uniref:Exonuclease domain-containing protein n=1 Tax=Marasmius crinis-equi TaxID=585013 RepID=A0ABR3FPA1_9AGAR